MAISFAQVKDLLARHGELRAQPISDWTGHFLLPSFVEDFYWEVGPANVEIKSYGNPCFLPSLAELWKYQAGYRWNSLSREPIKDWCDDWLVVAAEGGAAFVLSRDSGRILFAEHGTGRWNTEELFSSMNEMAACLATLGTIQSLAGESFVDEKQCIRSHHRNFALNSLKVFLGSTAKAQTVLQRLGWI